MVAEYNSSNAHRGGPPYPEKGKHLDIRKTRDIQNVESGHSSRDDDVFTAFNDKKVRKDFVTKVYTILTVQLLVTTAIVALFRFVVIFIPIFYTLVCCSKVARNFPLNFILLSLLTIAMGFILSILCLQYEVDSIIIALGIVVALVFSLTLLAACTDIDFTKCYLLGCVLILVLFLTGIAAMIVYAIDPKAGRILHCVYAGLGVMVFSLYIVMDTQQILGGKRHQISPEDYIFGALMLYMDVVNLFMFVLQLVGGVGE